jgi:hypothetical protein
VIRQQRADGGFGGRRGDSDLYYTDFALRTLSLASAPDDVLQRAANYLTSVRPKAGDVVECFSWLNAGRMLGLPPQTNNVEAQFIAPDVPHDAPDSRPQRQGAMNRATTQGEGRGMTDAGVPTTVYEAFIGALCWEIVDGILPPAPSLGGRGNTANGILPPAPSLGGRGETANGILPPAPSLGGRGNTADGTLPSLGPDVDAQFIAPGPCGTEPDTRPQRQGAMNRATTLSEGGGLPGPQTVALVSSLQGDDGGFRGQAGEGEEQTNATAAAIAFLTMAEALDPEQAERACRFLASMQARDGGFLAHAKAPVSDLLSTFTGFLCLAMLDAHGALDLPALGRFVRSCAEPDGGFRAGPYDDAPDVEYTYYGVACVALLRAVIGMRR